MSCKSFAFEPSQVPQWWFSRIKNLEQRVSPLPIAFTLIQKVDQLKELGIMLSFYLSRQDHSLSVISLGKITHVLSVICLGKTIHGLSVMSFFKS